MVVQAVRSGVVVVGADEGNRSGRCSKVGVSGVAGCSLASVYG